MVGLSDNKYMTNYHLTFRTQSQVISTDLRGDEEFVKTQLPKYFPGAELLTLQPIEDEHLTVTESGNIICTKCIGKEMGRMESR